MQKIINIAMNIVTRVFVILSDLDQFEDLLLTVRNRNDDSSPSYYGGTTITESSVSCTEDEVSLHKAYSHDTITSLRGTYKCHADTTKVTECPIYDVINE